MPEDNAEKEDLSDFRLVLKECRRSFISGS